MSTDFKETIQKLEEDIDGGADKVKEILDSADREQVAAMMELATEEDSEISSEDSKKETSEEKPKEEKSEEVKPESDTEVKKDESKPDTGEKEPPLEESKPIKITDEYIAKADEKDRQILLKAKGWEMSPEAIKSLVEANRKIGELGQKVGELQKPTERKPVIPDVIPKQQLTEEVQKLKEIEVTNRLRQSGFKDLPNDPIEVREYLAGLQQSDPDAYWDYRELKREIQKQVSDDFDKAIYVQQNQEMINNTILNGEIQKITEELKEYGIEDPLKAGLDFSIINSPDGKNNNQLLRELITIDGNKLDPQIVTYIGNVPIFNENALFNKFFLKKGKLIRDFLKEQTAIKAKKEAFETLANGTSKVNNTASVAKGTAASTTKAKPEIKNFDDVPRTQVLELLKESSQN